MHIQKCHNIKENSTQIYRKNVQQSHVYIISKNNEHCVHVCHWSGQSRSMPTLKHTAYSVSNMKQDRNKMGGWYSAKFETDEND